MIAFAKQHKWTVDTKGGKITFDAVNGSGVLAAAIPAEKMIGLSFGYARELERIV